MIARIWRGITPAEISDAYAKFLHTKGLEDYKATPGNRGIQVLHRIVGDRAEFVLITLWDSMDAIRAFAGDDPEKAVYYPEDDDFLIDRELNVAHYEILETH
jgi:heme-degrading monooxygenase HmoA